ncbi:uncharacterized protein LOC124940687 [Impatiens glandulifera]|uniref:uncharacterized protein LOC124940687 n=1 Tax=Impatiens glandulifera TaxID=253017 RepID=UPI001FB06288|nr:uncharacterized protein LOC124940687 [Impatiens glandulifera]
MVDISGLVMKFKVHIIVITTLSLLIVALICIAPSFVDIIAYFWPLLVSTALFLIAVVVFSQTSPIATDSSAAAEGLLDYVANTPEEIQTYISPEQREEQSLPSSQVDHDDDDDVDDSQK